MRTGSSSPQNHHRKSDGQPGIEQERFGQRLKMALAASHFPDDSPTHLAREFNMRFPDLMVTVHAARKWLIGEAIPTQARLMALAEWLNVSAAWLRFADTDAGKPSARDKRDVHRDLSALSLIADLQRLDQKDLEIAREFIRILLRASQNR